MASQGPHQTHLVISGLLLAPFYACVAGRPRFDHGVLVVVLEYVKQGLRGRPESPTLKALDPKDVKKAIARTLKMGKHSLSYPARISQYRRDAALSLKCSPTCPRLCRSGVGASDCRTPYRASTPYPVEWQRSDRAEDTGPLPLLHLRSAAQALGPVRSTSPASAPRARKLWRGTRL